MAQRLIAFTPQLVAVLPERKFVHMARIGKPDPVACLYSVWSMLGLSWVRWELLVQDRCTAAGIATWPAKSSNGRRTLLVTWHKVPEVLELMWKDLSRHAKAGAVNESAKLIRSWPDKRALAPSRQLVTRDFGPGNTDGAASGFDAPEGLQSAIQKQAGVLVPNRKRFQITKEHQDQAIKLRAQGLKQSDIAKRMKIGRSTVCQLLNGTHRIAAD